MQISLCVEILSGEAQVVFECFAVIVRVFIGWVVAEGVLVVPTPHRRIGLVDDNTRGVEMIGVDEINLGRFSGDWLLDDRHRNITR